MTKVLEGFRIQIFSVFHVNSFTKPRVTACGRKQNLCSIKKEVNRAFSAGGINLFKEDLWE